MRILNRMKQCLKPRAAALALALVLAASLAVAQEGGGAVRIDLPRQPLEESLTTAGQAFGLTVVAPGELLRDKVAPAVSGELTADEAVRLLLEGSGLEAGRSANGALVVREKGAPEPRSEAGADDAAGPGTAQDGLRLEPMVITGERTTRTLYDTAASATAFTGEDIDNSPGFREVDDILQFVPNVDLGGNSNEGPTIRGVKAGGPLSGVYAFFGGSRPRATVTVDGRPVSFDEFIFGATSLWDVERVEVFRGPQTTSQGVNSIAGAIHVVTADPTFEPHAKIQTEFGDYRAARFSASASGPLVDDELAVLLSADLRRRDSFIDIQPTQDYGPDPNTILSEVLRGKVLWEPNGAPELKMKLTLTSSKNEGPQAEYVRKPYKDLRAISVNLPSRRIVANTGIHDVSYAFSDNLELSNRFSYGKVDSTRYVDVDRNGRAEIDREELNNETTLHWKSPENGLSGLLAAFYQHTDSDEFLNLAACGLSSFDDKQESLGLYSELTYDITDRLDLTLGLRYQSDGQERRGTSTGGALYNVDLDFDKTYEAWLPKAVLGYDVTDDFRVGGLVSRGFNPGGVTLIWTSGAINRFDEETVWNYELFTRSKLLDNRLLLDTNLFYAKYSGYQMNYLAGMVGTTEVYGIANADDAESYGLEASAQYLVTEALHLMAGFGLLHTEIKKFEDAGGIDAEGASFMRSPDLTLTLGADYEVLEGLKVGGRVRYVGSYKSEDTNDSPSAGDYTVCDIQGSYAFGDFTVYAFVNNVFDQYYRVSELAIGRAIIGNPREFGVGIRYAF